MGQAATNTVCEDPELELVGAVDIDNYGPDVAVDFTQHDATMPAARTAIEHHVNMVIGTTGLSNDELDNSCQFF